MQTTALDPYQNIPRDAVVTVSDYADGELFPSHIHQRGQFAYAARGVITIFTDEGNWVVPPLRGIPATFDCKLASAISNGDNKLVCLRQLFGLETASLLRRSQ